MSGVRVRVPFIPLDMNNKNLAELGEILVDGTEKELYIKLKTSGKIINIPQDSSIDDETYRQLGPLLDNVDVDGDTLKKIHLLVQYLKDTMDFHTHSNDNILANNIYKILILFSGYSNSDPTLLELLDTKVDKEEGKDLIRVNLNDTYKEKIESIEENANLYEHPISPQCDVKDDVISVNGQTGKVVIDRRHIVGLEDVHPQANKYIHPEYKVCNHLFNVFTLNGYDGDVHLNNADIGLSELLNYRIATVKDVKDGAKFKYMTPKVMHDYIKDRLKIV